MKVSPGTQSHTCLETQVGVVGDGENAMEKFDDRVTVPSFALSREDSPTTLEATQVQVYGVFRQIPYEFHQIRVASVGD